MDHEDVKPDILILGKALSGGVLPVSDSLRIYMNLLYSFFQLKNKDNFLMFHEYICINTYQYKQTCTINMSQCMRFPTKWYVGPAKAQISLRIRAV